MMLSEYLDEDEIRCKHCGSLPLDLYDGDRIADIYADFFEIFSIIRGEWGKPIRINSGYRCQEYNDSINGNPLSVHLWGLALDMNCKTSQEVHDLSNIVNSVDSDLRMGKYYIDASFIHIDMGYFIYPRASEYWHKGARW